MARQRKATKTKEITVDLPAQSTENFSESTVNNTAERIKKMTVIQLRAFIKEQQNDPELDHLMDIYIRDTLQTMLIEKLGL